MCLILNMYDINARGQSVAMDIRYALTYLLAKPESISLTFIIEEFESRRKKGMLKPAGDTSVISFSSALIQFCCKFRQRRESQPRV